MRTKQNQIFQSNTLKATGTPGTQALAGLKAPVIMQSEFTRVVLQEIRTRVIGGTESAARADLVISSAETRGDRSCQYSFATDISLDAEVRNS